VISGGYLPAQISYFCIPRRRAFGSPGWPAMRYGLGSKLREACEKDREGYVLAVPVNCTVTLSSGRKAAVSAVAG
jgi:hypothetical protein